MNLKSSTPQNKPIYFNGLLANLTGSILVSPTISSNISNKLNFRCRCFKIQISKRIVL